MRMQQLGEPQPSPIILPQRGTGPPPPHNCRLELNQMRQCLGAFLTSPGHFAAAVRPLPPPGLSIPHWAASTGGCSTLVSVSATTRRAFKGKHSICLDAADKTDQKRSRGLNHLAIHLSRILCRLPLIYQYKPYFSVLFLPLLSSLSFPTEPLPPFPFLRGYPNNQHLSFVSPFDLFSQIIVLIIQNGWYVLHRNSTGSCFLDRHDG